MNKEDFLQEVQSFCNDEGIVFSYYYDTNTEAYNFRVRKSDKVKRIKFSVIDIENLPKINLMSIFYREIQKMYDEIQRERYDKQWYNLIA